MSRLDLLRMTDLYRSNNVVLLNKYNVLRGVGAFAALLHPQQADRALRKLVQVSQAVSRAAPLRATSVPGSSIWGGRVAVGKWDATISRLKTVLKEDSYARHFFREYLKQDNVQFPYVEARLARGSAFYLLPSPGRTGRESGRADCEASRADCEASRADRDASCADCNASRADCEAALETSPLESSLDSHRMMASREELMALVRKCVTWELEKHFASLTVRESRVSLASSTPSIEDIDRRATRDVSMQILPRLASTPLPTRRHALVAPPEISDDGPLLPPPEDFADASSMQSARTSIASGDIPSPIEALGIFRIPRPVFTYCLPVFWAPPTDSALATPPEISDDGPLLPTPEDFADAPSIQHVRTSLAPRDIRRAASEPAINFAGQVVEAPKLVQPRPLITLQPTQAAPLMIAELKAVLARRGRVE
ncbi:hypothetical protein [Pararobbsia alpina]|uniref:Uncharacterized protein n=1 Tax=Pararobbsia alpina TaxID=621374 RepID=A0A6S7AZR0_9BURK|nr:hypothetical protein [Pararobbsia alpina]CAB3783082.1 hypothetical protein LMG28138_01567 [Pararobbsia alpina]